MNALIVTPFYKPNIGGAETFAEDFAKFLSKKYVVHVCTIKHNKPIIWQGMNFVKSFRLLSKMIWPLIKMRKKYKYEKVFALGLMSSFLCAVLGIKFDAILLALYDFNKPNIYTFILNRANKVFVEGKRCKEECLRIGVNKEKIVMFQHWCDQSMFFYKERNNKNMKVLFVGRPIEKKGKHIIEQCQKMTKGIDYEYIENVPFKDLPKHYQDNDVLVVPSLYSESFTRVVIEAASCGCAILTSNYGSLPEQVNGFGKAIDPNPYRFKEELERLRDNDYALERLQLRTFIYAKKNFNESNANCFLL